MQDLIGRTLGHYRIVEKIGAGGMGEVFRARDERLDRDVAIKVLPEGVAQTPKRLARFEREAKAVARLSHPNILEIFDYGYQGEITYAVTEFLEGKDLGMRLVNGPLRWRTAAEIGAAIADGVAAAHKAGVVHRDLKPSNVFLTTDDRVKILDFGLAGYEAAVVQECDDNAPTLTQTEPGTVLGTVGYMSPEQVRGSSVDARSDIFSLGCVLHEMVSGERAFVADTSVGTMNAILKDDPADLRASAQDLPPGLAGTIERCLEKNPELRFQSASDLAYSLRSLSSASTPSIGRPARRLPGRRKIALSLGLVALAAVALVWRFPSDWRWGLDRPGGIAATETIDSLAVLPFANIGSDDDTEYLSVGIPASIIDRLSALSGLRVVPRRTAFHFRDPNLDLTDVARQLDVGAILTGEIRTKDGVLVIRVELVDVSTDHQLWGERLTGTVDDILATENRIATSVAESLRFELSGTERELPAARGTSNPEAHRYFLRANYLLNIVSEENIRRAVEDLSSAIELDPNFALALSGLSESWVFLADRGWEARGIALPEARRAAERALAIDDTLAEAHGALALVAEYEWQPATADREYRRALELDPSCSVVRGQWAFFLALRGSFAEAIAESRLVLETDPLSARENRNLGAHLFSAGRYRNASEQVELGLEMHPGDQGLWRLRIRILAVQRDFDGALLDLERSSELDGNHLQFLGWTYARAGRTEEARKVLDELDRLSCESPISPTYFAMVYGGLGDRDRAFEYLESALAKKDPLLIYLKYHPEWGPIREDPRFTALVSRISYFDEI